MISRIIMMHRSFYSALLSNIDNSTATQLNCFKLYDKWLNSSYNFGLVSTCN